jgi:hypothetical protein
LKDSLGNNFVTDPRGARGHARDKLIAVARRCCLNAPAAPRIARRLTERNSIVMMQISGSRLFLLVLLACAALSPVPLVGCSSAPGGGAGGKGGSGTTGMGGATAGAGGSGGMAGAGGRGGSSGGGAGAGGTAGSAGACAGGSGGTGAGGAGCLETNPPPCLAASCQACLDSKADPTTDGCCAIATTDPAGYALCQAASACMRSGKCNLAGDVTTCYCGTHQGDCDVAGMPNGPCVAQIAAAAGRNVMTQATDSPTEAQVIDRLGMPEYAVGRAANIQGVAAFYCATDCAF